jgi:hypothetical protein
VKCLALPTSPPKSFSGASRSHQRRHSALAKGKWVTRLREAEAPLTFSVAQEAKEIVFKVPSWV